MVYNYQQQFKWTVENLNPFFTKVIAESWYSFNGLSKKEYGAFVKKLDKKIKQHLFNNCPNEWNKYKIIVDLKMRDQIGIKENQKTFLSCSVYLRKNKKQQQSSDPIFVLNTLNDILSNIENFTFSAKK